MNTNASIGTVVTYLKRQYKVTGYEPSRPKFPYSVERLPDGKRFKMPADVVEGVKAAPTASAPSPASPSFRIGDRVEFTCTKRGKVGVISGTVKSLNAKSVTLTDTSDGHPVGWRVTPGMLRSSTSPAPVKTASVTAPVPPVTVRVGQAVTFTGSTWASKFQPVTCTGVVTLVDYTKGEVEVYSASLPMGSKRMPANMVQATKRSDKEIVAAAGAVFSGLSPENLTCDGERARADVNRIYASLQRALRALQIEAGRTISEGETYGDTV